MRFFWFTPIDKKIHKYLIARHKNLHLAKLVKLFILHKNFVNTKKFHFDKLVKLFNLYTTLIYIL
jgi:hypothetical protein